MTNIANLLTEHIDIWTAADTEKKSGRGRASGNTGGVYGVRKLRELILELAVRGKLVAQDADDEPASQLLKHIQAEKAKLIAEGKLKKEKPLAPISEGEKPFELPETWVWSRLAEIGSTQTGTTPSKSDLNAFGNDVPFIKPGDIYPNFVDYENEGLSKEGALNGRVAETGSLLMVCIGTIGKCNIIERDCSFNQQINSITPYQIDSKYLLIAARSNYFQSECWSNSSSTTLPILNKGKWEQIGLPIPPLSEQHRIVAKVDELMALCDQLEQQHSNAQEAHETLVSQLLATLTQSQNAAEFNANWQRIYAHFDVLFSTEASIDALKQTLLQLAVMGKLVPQNPNDEPASELLKRIQAEKTKLIAEGKLKKEKPLSPIDEDEKPFELPKGWEWVRLSDISTYIQYGYTDSANQTNRDVLFLRITDIQDDFVDWSKVPGCNSTLNQVQDYLLSENDIVIARTGGTIGKSYLVKNLTAYSIFASYLIRIGKIESVNHKFKKLYFGSQLYWNQLYANSMGTGQPNVNGTALKGLLFSLPPIEEQHRIVAKVDALMALCDQLKTRIQQANQQQQAIADALVAQAVS